jgi:hypothetical protein
MKYEPGQALAGNAISSGIAAVSRIPLMMAKTFSDFVRNGLTLTRSATNTAALPSKHRSTCEDIGDKATKFVMGLFLLLSFATSFFAQGWIANLFVLLFILCFNGMAFPSEILGSKWQLLYIVVAAVIQFVSSTWLPWLHWVNTALLLVALIVLAVVSIVRCCSKTSLNGKTAVCIEKFLLSVALYPLQAYKTYDAEPGANNPEETTRLTPSANKHTQGKHFSIV